jgi:hypothetical protein
MTWNLALYEIKAYITLYVCNSSDDDFIGAGLGGMGYTCRSHIKTIPNCKFIRGRFQTEIIIIIFLQEVMFQNVIMGPRISKEKQIF